MAVNNKPQDDAKAMTDEYISGVTINDIADKYNHTVEEVEAVVTQEPAVTPATTQADEDAKQAATEPKKK